MKTQCLALVFAALASSASIAAAQSMPPPLPALTADQQSRVQQDMQTFSAEVENRVNRGELAPDDADRLLAWHEWQVAQQAAGVAPQAAPAPTRTRVVQAPPVVVERPYYAPPVYYGPYPYYAPYYVAPWWGPAICAGGWGRHGGGRVCF